MAEGEDDNCDIPGSENDRKPEAKHMAQPSWGQPSAALLLSGLRMSPTFAQGAGGTGNPPERQSYPGPPQNQTQEQPTSLPEDVARQLDFRDVHISAEGSHHPNGDQAQQNISESNEEPTYFLKMPHDLGLSMANGGLLNSHTAQAAVGHTPLPDAAEDSKFGHKNKGEEDKEKNKNKNKGKGKGKIEIEEEEEEAATDIKKIAKQEMRRAMLKFFIGVLIALVLGIWLFLIFVILGYQF